MKFRTGFVSNSSSSSFVVMLPKDYQLPAGENEQVEELFNLLISNKEIWYEEMAEKDDDYWQQNQDSELEPYSDGYHRLIKILDKYVVSTISGGGDGEGNIVLGKGKGG